MTEMVDATSFLEASSSSSPPCTQLVLVCCHGIYMGSGNGGDGGRNIASEDQWKLAHQPSEHSTFIAHITTAATHVSQHHPEESLLIFSGGRTTTHPRSEASSYALVLQSLIQQTPPTTLHNHNRIRYALEEHATDTYQNLLFSILRFRQITNHYPTSILVVTHGFKSPRILDLHGPAIRWPHDRLRVQGISPPFTRAQRAKAWEGEREGAYRHFVEDPYGVRGLLGEKRRRRNWRAEEVPGLLGCGLEAEVRELLVWEGGVSGCEIFPRRLPWEDGGEDDGKEVGDGERR